jgi:uncharacterized protein (TIGR02284 family)
MMTMTTTTPSAAHGRASGLLNRLIAACNDGARAQDRAALVVNGATRRARLEDSASRRLAFANELAELVRSLGGTPRDGGSTVEGLRAAANRVRAVLVGENGGDAYSTCARVEAHAERLYEVAIAAELPGPARLVVARHHAEVVADHAELRRLSMGG